MANAGAPMPSSMQVDVLSSRGVHGGCAGFEVRAVIVFLNRIRIDDCLIVRWVFEPDSNICQINKAAPAQEFEMLHDVLSPPLRSSRRMFSANRLQYGIRERDQHG
jgi:hypothetical protein